ncbi:phage tail protein [Chitiniphilus purpureus]|uniref:Phage tail protein n=1 Tax=Chitiniphilus purpureus TaxID=2981137 RepID=A0ABY6DQV2_9NEIS|nr:phage tail protein [Chitiniphilus sp. CD1]UXY16730.1 phage tail protein [Chitiniphilus sp. CD1]
MLKPNSLRATLLASVPGLNVDPDRLQIFLDEGRIIATGAHSHSFEYAYTLNAIITEYAGHADAIVVPVLSWLHVNQPDLLDNPDKRRDGFVFEADLLSHGGVDLSLKIQLTERVVVRQGEGGALTAEHCSEPPDDPRADVERWTLFIKGEPVASWPPVLP